MSSKYKIILFSLIIILSIIFELENVHSQTVTKEFTDYVKLRNNDTLIIHRSPSALYYNIFGGVNTNFFFSNLSMAKNYELPASMRSYVHLPNTLGVGYFGGFGLDWQEPDSKIGYSVKLSFFDYLHTYSESDKYNVGHDSSKAYGLISDFTYLNFSPSIRYNPFTEGFYLFGGLELQYLITRHLTPKYYTYADTILADVTGTEIPINKINIRVCLNVGIGYDIFAADINHRVKLYFSPFVALNVGTIMVSDAGSSQNSTVFRAGVSFRFSPDKVVYDTIKFDPNSIKPPTEIAKSKEYKKSNISFAGFKTYQSKTNELIAAVEAHAVEQEIAQVPSISVEGTVESKIGSETSTTSSTTTSTVDAKRLAQIKSGYTKTITFNTQITSADQKELDLIVEYLKKNPKARLSIVGHTDDQGGSKAANLKQSEQRAAVIVQYFTKKNIARRRLLDKGEGALKPVADNSTEAGRRQNRRVTVSVQ